MSGASWRAYFPDEASHEPIWVGTLDGAPIADVRDPDVAKLIAAAPRLAEALKGLIADLEALMEDTEGVEMIGGDGVSYMNWERMLPGGKYEYLTHWNEARAALREAGVDL